MKYEPFLSLKDIGCSDMQFKLLCLWGQHPKAKLTLNTIAIALDVPKNSIFEAITALVEKDILVTQCNSYGLTTYALSVQRGQEYIGKLAKLDRGEIVILGKQLKKWARSSSSKR